MRRRNVPHSKRLQPTTTMRARSVEARSASVRSRSVSQKPSSPAWSQGLWTSPDQSTSGMTARQVREVVGVAIEIREDTSGRRSSPRAASRRCARHPWLKASQAPSGWWTGWNQAGHLHLDAGRQGHGPPVVVGGVEGAPDVDRVDAQAVQQLVRRLRQLLDDVVDARALVGQAEVPHEVGVRARPRCRCSASSPGRPRDGRAPDARRSRAPARGTSSARSPGMRLRRRAGRAGTSRARAPAGR